jgi:two-component system, OmpR family, response regulator AdeR
MELILIAEDDDEISAILDAYLVREGFRTVRASDGQVALELDELLKPDLVLLDITMPQVDGWHVLAELRRRGETPIIILSALDQDIDRLQGLRFGADDYVVKPFNPVEVVARAKAVLRRASASRSARVLRTGPLTIDLDSYEVKVERPEGSATLTLTLTEFRLLTFLAKNPQKVYSRSELVDACLSETGALERTVDSHISNIRKKIEITGAEGLLPGIRGVGYKLLGSQ